LLAFKDFRSRELAKRALEVIEKLSTGESFTFMHVCGTHEQAITKHGLRSLLPENIKLIAGPGCPVCVTPASDVDAAVALAEDGKVVLTYGDALRVPGSELSLAQVKAKGGEVRVVYGIREAIKLAKAEPEKEFVFFSIGLDTTAPSIAAEVARGLPANLSILNALRLTVPIMELLMGMGDLHFEGYLAPGHVSAIIGARAYEVIPKAYGMPVVISGFEPIDVLLSIAMLIKQIYSGEARVENEYTRAVSYEGNIIAQELISRVFDVATVQWRGIGRVPFSGLKLREEYAEWDARERYDLKESRGVDIRPGCSCHLVIIGKLSPQECRMFRSACTPAKPYGPCMVSQEGTCNVAYRYSQQEV
jgi:hydrogenase expression/formation protein HypD